VYLACALVAKDQNARDSFLAKFEQITKTSGLDVAAQSLLGGIYRSTKDGNLQDAVKHAADDLARYEGKPAAR
jgi:hypothetical protein